MKRSLVFLILTVIVVSCKKEKVPASGDPACTDTVSFNSTILPLINTNCTGCHDVGNTNGYTFTNHTNISNNAAIMLNAMRGQGGVQLMPPTGEPLPDSLIQKFSCWISQGKNNN